MKHDKQFDDLLMLYFYNELSDSDRAGFERHINECRECQAELKRLKLIADKMICANEPVPSQTLLSGLNQRIMQEIAGDLRRPIPARIKEYFDELFESATLTMARPRYQLIAVGLTFVIGIFVGKIWLSSGLRHDPEMLANLVNYNYQMTDNEKNNLQKAFAGYLLKSGGIEVADLFQANHTPENNGLVEVNVKIDKNLAIRGGLDDPTIQNMLMYSAMHDQTTERRLRAVRLLGQVIPEPNINATLFAVMLHDADEEIRLLATQLLEGRTMNEQRLEAYKSVALRDSSVTIRKMALANLVKYGSRDIIPVIALVAARDADPDVRILARSALDELYVKNSQEQK